MFWAAKKPWSPIKMLPQTDPMSGGEKNVKGTWWGKKEKQWEMTIKNEWMNGEVWMRFMNGFDRDAVEKCMANGWKNCDGKWL